MVEPIRRVRARAPARKPVIRLQTIRENHEVYNVYLKELKERVSKLKDVSDKKQLKDWLDNYRFFIKQIDPVFSRNNWFSLSILKARAKRIEDILETQKQTKNLEDKDFGKVIRLFPKK